MNIPLIFIITGEQGEGKSSFAGEVAGRLRENQISVGGIIAEGRWRGNVRSGFDISDPASGRRMHLAERDHSGGPDSSLKFVFDSKALKKGMGMINHAMDRKDDVIILDEVGARELGGGIWADALERLLDSYNGILILTVRRKFLRAVRERWDIDPAAIFDVRSARSGDAAEIIIRSITSSCRGRIPIF